VISARYCDKPAYHHLAAIRRVSLGLVARQNPPALPRHSGRDASESIIGGSRAATCIAVSVSQGLIAALQCHEAADAAAML